jgi:hypothetical protein
MILLEFDENNFVILYLDVDFLDLLDSVDKESTESNKSKKSISDFDFLF